MTPFSILMLSMTVLAVLVFVVLFFVKAGYGVFCTRQWGRSISNRTAWVLMEFPAFALMLALWIVSNNREWVPLVFLLLFELHYAQRTFVFPFLIKGKGRMPLSIMCMGAFFNTLNASMIGYWLFFHEVGVYGVEWFATPQFVLGLMMFGLGMYINIDSDRRIRGLRKEGDTRHYMPQGGMYDYVSSANYFGEFVEWVGFAVLTWSLPGAIFALWTFANLAPRAAAIHAHYADLFGEAFTSRNIKRMIPFIY